MNYDEIEVHRVNRGVAKSIDQLLNKIWDVFRRI